MLDVGSWKMGVGRLNRKCPSPDSSGNPFLEKCWFLFL